MDATNTPNNDIRQLLQQISEQVRQTDTKVDALKAEVDALKQEQALSNTRIDTYQKASTQVVGLAFSLIATASLAILTSVVLKR